MSVTAIVYDLVGCVVLQRWMHCDWPALSNGGAVVTSANSVGEHAPMKVAGKRPIRAAVLFAAFTQVVDYAAT